MELSIVCCKSMTRLLTWDYFCWNLAARVIPHVCMCCCRSCVDVEAARKIYPILGGFMRGNVEEIGKGSEIGERIEVGW